MHSLCISRLIDAPERTRPEPDESKVRSDAETKARTDEHIRHPAKREKGMDETAL